MEGHRGGGVCCLLEMHEGCSCQVNVLQCTIEDVETVVGKYIRWKRCSTGLLFVERNCILFCSSCGKRIFVCIYVGGCVWAWGIGWCRRDCLSFYTWWKLWPQPSSVLGLARRGQRSRWNQMQSCQVELSVMQEISLLQYVKRGRHICKTQSALPKVAKQPRMLGRSGGIPPPGKNCNWECQIRDFLPFLLIFSTYNSLKVN